MTRDGEVVGAGIPESAAIELGPASRAVRRMVGPTAWVVLEELALGATVPAAGSGSGAVMRVGASVRSLAESLEMSKDTVARALRRLAAAQLIERENARDASGSFGSSTYVVNLEAAGLAVRSVVAPSPHRPRRSPRPKRVTADPEQLTLLLPTSPVDDVPEVAHGPRTYEASNDRDLP